MLSLSIIIPTLNEAENIATLLKYLQSLDPDAELIVADCGSTDDTVKQAVPFARVVRSDRGRGVQMNAGAAQAKGDVLWFLHADCKPHPGSIKAIHRAMGIEEIVGGGFTYGLNHPGLLLRITENYSNFKNRTFKMLYGDMGIFVRKTAFKEIDGYQVIPLMEDMDFSKRLKKVGRVVIYPLQMQTSARRWIEDGWIKSCVRSWLLQSAWTLGVKPELLAKYYRFK